MVDGLSYDFEGRLGMSVNLDAQLLRNIGISGDTDSTLGGKSGLRAATPMLVGYRLCRLDAKAGFSVSDITAEELLPEQVNELKHGTASSVQQ